MDNNSPIWIKKEAVIALHTASIQEFGGSYGIRDEGLLESALAKPKNLFSYTANVNLAELAASYAAGLAKNHPFVDGNKRIALITCELFLLLNSAHLEASQVEKYHAFWDLASSAISQEEFASWIAERIA